MIKKQKTVMIVVACLLIMLVAAACAQPASETLKSPAPGENGVIYADEWKEVYPDIYASYMANSENSGNYSYVEAHPDIQTLYKGMGFSRDYNSARGHVYTLEDVTATSRPHALANCLSCKTPDFVALLEKYGESFYMMGFDEAMEEVESPISCYDCHGNNPETGPVAMRQYLYDALGDDYNTLDGGMAVCAQCHVEYYFNPETKATTLPYADLSSLSPDQILAYYNDMGFTDFQNPDTLTNLIKVQHPEFETVMGEGGMHAGSLSCADCHMEKVTKDDGATYVSHTWVSPMSNENIMNSVCLTCHTGTIEDVKAKVTTTQEEIVGQTEVVSAMLVELTNKLAAAVASGEYTEEELNAIRALNRDAQFYWDFVFVENSNGAHNSSLSRTCLEKAEVLTNEAMALFH